MGCGLDNAYEIQFSLDGRDHQTIGNDAFTCKQSRLISLLSKDPAELVSLGSAHLLYF